MLHKEFKKTKFVFKMKPVAHVNGGADFQQFSSCLQLGVKVQEKFKNSVSARQNVFGI